MRDVNDPNVVEDNENNQNIDNEDNQSQYTEVDDEYLRGGYGVINEEDNNQEHEINFENININDPGFVNRVGEAGEEIDNENLRRVQEEMEYENNTPSHEKVYDYLQKQKVFDHLDTFVNLGISKDDYLKMYNEAYADNATDEQKIAWALFTLDYHQGLNRFLTEHWNINPDSFNSLDQVATINNAYSLNSEVCAKAIANCGGNIFDKLIEKAFFDVHDSSYQRTIEENDIKFQNNLAKYIYLCGLKYEFDNVHGTDEEIKAWKQEILNELLSDSYENKIQQAKNSDFFKKALPKFKKESVYSANSAREVLSETAIEAAEEKYNDIYYTFAIGVQDENEKQDVLKTVEEIEKIKAIYSPVISNEEEDKTFNEPCFDTMFIKKKANLYGRQNNVVGDLINQRKEAKKIEKRIFVASQERHNKNRNTVYQLMKQFAGKEDLIQAIDEIIEADTKYLECIENLANLEKAGNRAENLKKYEEYMKKSDEEKNEAEMMSDPVLYLYIRREIELDKKTKIKEAILNRYDYKVFDEAYDIYANQIKPLKGSPETYKRVEREVTEEVNKQVDEENAIKAQEPLRLKQEALEYKQSKEANNIEKLNEIKQKRAQRDLDEKSSYPQLYKTVNTKNGTGYISRSSVEAKDLMVKDYADYKKKWILSNQEIQDYDDAFNNSILDFDNTEKSYTKKIEINKPDRSGNKINYFKPQQAEVTGLIELDDVKIDRTVTKFKEPEPLPPIPDQYSLSEPYIYAAWMYANIKPKVLFGTAEYDRINNDLKQLHDDIIKTDNSQLSNAYYLPKARLILARMNHYIDRKNDAKDNNNGRESDNARIRRENITAARTNMRSAIIAMEKKAGVKYTAAENLLADLTVIKELTRENNDDINAIISDLENNNKVDALRKMKAFIDKYYEIYKGENGYPFRLKDDENGKDRIPFSETSRYYKSVLLGFQKLGDEYLTELSKDKPEKFYDFKIEMMHDNKDILKPVDYSKKYGITLIPESYEAEIKINKCNTLEDYAKQFEKNYQAMVDMASFKHLIAYRDRIINKNNIYNPDAIITSLERKALLENALSAIFLNELDKNNKAHGINAPFDFEAVEQQRIKFISAIKKSSLSNNLASQVARYFDLSEKNGDMRDEMEYIQNRSNGQKVIIKDLENFNKLIMAPALKDGMRKNIKDFDDMVSGAQKYDKAKGENLIKSIDYDLKVSKALKITNDIDGVNNVIKSAEIKGEKLTDSAKKMLDAVKARKNQKTIEPTKGIKL